MIRIRFFGPQELIQNGFRAGQYAGRIWKGDVLIADLEELETMVANLLRKTQCERGDISQKRRFYFSNSRWTNQNTWRRSGTENIHFDTAATNSRRESRGLFGKSEGSLPQPEDSCPGASEAIFDFWSMSGHFKNHHHVEARVKLYSPSEESFLLPLKYTDVTRTTHTNLDVKQEKRIDDYWNT